MTASSRFTKGRHLNKTTLLPSVSESSNVYVRFYSQLLLFAESIFTQSRLKTPRPTCSLIVVEMPGWMLTTATHFSRSIVKCLSRHELAGIGQPIIHSLSSLGKRRRFASLVKLLITEYFILCLLAAGYGRSLFLLGKQLKVFGVF